MIFKFITFNRFKQYYKYYISPTVNTIRSQELIKLDAILHNPTRCLTPLELRTRKLCGNQELLLKLSILQIISTLPSCHPAISIPISLSNPYSSLLNNLSVLIHLLIQTMSHLVPIHVKLK